MAYRQQRSHHPYEEIESEESPYSLRSGRSEQQPQQQRAVSRANMRENRAPDQEKTYDYLPMHARSSSARRGGEMVSRRKILSRSRDDINLDVYHEEEDDVWYKKEKLFSDHIREVLAKWESIDDEIWAKVIVFERNRRVAKAYARVGVLTIHGSDVGFDGSRIGLCGFDNPLRDPKVEEVKKYIGTGVKVKMDNEGNMMVKKLAKSNVFVRYSCGENAVGSDILKLPQAALEINKGLTLFDLKKFQQNVNREMKRQYPDRTRLETQCMTSLVFVKNDDDLLNCPCWLLVINIVALDMLKGKLMPATIPPSISAPNRNTHIPIPDEDPYSLAGSGGSSGSSGKLGRSERPPKLPPRDTEPVRNKNAPVPDYEDEDTDDVDDMPRAPALSAAVALRSRLHANSRGKTKKERKKGDELYYGGFQARIPNFVRSRGGALDEVRLDARDLRDMRSGYGPPHPAVPVGPQHPLVWHTRSYDGDNPYFPGLRMHVPGLRGGANLAGGGFDSQLDSALVTETGGFSLFDSRPCRSYSAAGHVMFSAPVAPPPPPARLYRRERHRTRRRSQSRDSCANGVVTSRDQRRHWSQERSEPTKRTTRTATAAAAAVAQPLRNGRKMSDHTPPSGRNPHSPSPERRLRRSGALVSAGQFNLTAAHSTSATPAVSLTSFKAESQTPSSALNRLESTLGSKLVAGSADRATASGVGVSDLKSDRFVMSMREKFEAGCT